MERRKSKISVQRNEISNLPLLPSMDLYTSRIFNYIILCITEEILSLTGDNKIATTNYWDQIPKSLLDIEHGGIDRTSKVFKIPASQIAPPQNWSRVRQTILKLNKEKIGMPIPVNLSESTDLELGNFNKTKRAILIQEWQSFSITGFYNKIEFAENSNTIAVSVDMNFYRYVFNLNNGFTIYNTSTMLGLKSVYSAKMYEFLAQWRELGEVNITIDKLRLVTGTTCLYSRPSDFKTKVIDRAKKELLESKNSDLHFDYKVLKDRSGKIYKFKFFIFKNSNEEKKSIDFRDLKYNYDISVEKNLNNFGVKNHGKIKDMINTYIHIVGINTFANKLEDWYFKSFTMKNNFNSAAYIVGCLKKELLLFFNPDVLDEKLNEAKAKRDNN